MVFAFGLRESGIRLVKCELLDPLNDELGLVFITLELLTAGLITINANDFTA